MNNTRVVFNEYCLKGNYRNNADCPIHRAMVSSNVINPEYIPILRIGGNYFRFREDRIPFTTEMQDISDALSDYPFMEDDEKARLLGLAVDVPIPQEYLLSQEEDSSSDC